MDYNCEGVYLKIFTEEELSNERMWKTDQIVYGNIVPSLSNRKEYLEKSHRKDLIERCND